MIPEQKEDPDWWDAHPSYPIGRIWNLPSHKLGRQQDSLCHPHFSKQMWWNLRISNSLKKTGKSDLHICHFDRWWSLHSGTFYQKQNGTGKRRKHWTCHHIYETWLKITSSTAPTWRVVGRHLHLPLYTSTKGHNGNWKPLHCCWGLNVSSSSLPLPLSKKKVTPPRITPIITWACISICIHWRSLLFNSSRIKQKPSPSNPFCTFAAKEQSVPAACGFVKLTLDIPKHMTKVSTMWAPRSLWMGW